MIVHCVMFKWKPDASKEDIARDFEELRALKPKIKSIREIYCGENFSQYGRGYTHAVIVFTDDIAGLDEFRNHPDHLIVAKRVLSMKEALMSVDIDTEAPFEK